MIAQTPLDEIPGDGLDHTADDELLDRCRAGDQAAWNLLVERYSRLVYSVPRRHGLSGSDCDDVFQAVFLTLFEKLDTVRDGRRLAGWLATTTRRQCWRVMRRSDLSLPDLSGVETEASTREAVEAWESREIVHRAMDRLGDRDREVLSACFRAHGDTSYRQVAQTLGMPMGSLGPTRARAFRRLADILEQMGFDAGDDATIPELAASVSG